MKTHKLQPILTLTILAVLVLTLLPTNSVFAATCTGSGCNGIDPQGTTCWNDATIANWVWGSDGTMKNRNMYTPGCVSNWSYTLYPTATYLAAETVGVFRYEAPRTYTYVWNSMWDGSGLVCTRGYKGSSQGNYDIYSNSVCA